MSNFKITHPHAAVLIWNYEDRIGIPKGEFDATGVKNQDGTTSNPSVIISTLSCVSIQTNKSKATPEGSFNLVLAPYRNWNSTIATGSWCALLMSNTPISKEDLRQANPDQVKMFGRIESVRCETQVGDEGERHTLYYVSGVDWGHIFNSSLYIDNLIASENDPRSQGNSAAVAIQNLLFGKDNAPSSFDVTQNLTNIIDVMGKSLAGYSEKTHEVGRLANTIYDFTLPDKVAEFFQFQSRTGDKKRVSRLINMVSGSLVGPDNYNDTKESYGFIDPFSLQGTHSIWQILMENSNPTLNEMFCDMRWDEEGTPVLTLYNRIKPFSLKALSGGPGQNANFVSLFKNVATHELDPIDILSVNAGTNWRDKVNFIEIKPQFQEFQVVANWFKQKSQTFDEKAFKREGFRPLIFDTKQFPSGGNVVNGLPEDIGIDWSRLEVWAQALRDWYFGTHRMLNGTLTMYGSTEYIGVGNNIRFDVGLLNPNPNIKSKVQQSGSNVNQFVLAHVESVSHSFTVGGDGARTYRTTINFVRGVIVNENNSLIGGGMLDEFTDSLADKDQRNQLNTISTSEKVDPDRLKPNGT